jgi:hypothetical protein
MALFTNFVDSKKLSQVTYYSYFPVLEEGSGKEESMRLLFSDNAIAYTVKFNFTTKAISEGEKNWFNQPLIDLADKSRFIPKEKIKRLDFSKKKHNKCIVLNLLDYCYGHSLIKLLNIESFYRDYSETHDLFILSFPDVEDYLPLGKFNSCLLDLSFSEIKKIYNLRSVLDKVRENYSEVDFGVLDAYLKIDNKPQKVDFYNYFGSAENKYIDKKLVTFHYRADDGRAWGEGSQVKNVIKLFTILRPYFSKEVIFCVLGDKDKHSFPDWIVDKRIQKYPNPLVYEYSQIVARSVMLISVTGSNMVLPSLLSKGMLVHFVKEPLIRLTGTDVVNYKNNINSSTYEHIYIFENGIRSISAKKLAFRLIRLFEGKLSIEFKSHAVDCVRNGKPASTQKEYILEQHSYFDYNRAKQLNAKVNTKYWNAINGNNFAKRVVKKIAKILVKK